MYGESPTDQGTAIVIETVPLPLTVSKPEFEAGWRDRGYALFFYVHFFLVFVLACYYGSHALSDDGSSTSTSTSLGVLDVNAVVMMKALTAATAAGGAMSAVLYAILRRCSGGLILTSLWLSVACQVACGSLLFAVSPFAGVMMLILAGFSALYIYFVRARIAFATAHVNVALAALRGAPSVLAVAVLLLLLQFVWVAIWGVAALGLEHAVNNGGPGSATSTPTSGGTGAAGGVLLFLALTSFYYTSAVLRNAVAFISASVVGSWWFEGSTQKAPVRGALGRAFTTSFGTLSFGALLISAVAALRVVARSGRRRSNENIGVLILACIGECLLRILQMVVEWANHWAITYAALTGLAFIPAGKAAFALFKSRGFTAIINQDLVTTALAIGSLASAGVGALAGGAVSYSLDTSPDRTAHAGVAALLCFLLSLTMASVATSLISSATRAVFVAWALSPGALATTQPGHLAALAVAWHEFHPQACTAAGYDALSSAGSGGGGGSSGGGAYATVVAIAPAAASPGYAAPNTGGAYANYA